MTNTHSSLWALKFMLRMWRRSRREGVPYQELVEQQLAIMRKETEALALQVDHLRMARELREIERDVAESLPPA